MADKEKGVPSSSGGAQTSSGSAQSSSGHMLSTELRGLPCFNPREDPNTLSVRWKRWKRSFNLYVLAKGITKDTQKVALLLHTGGLDLQELYFTLVPEEEAQSFADCLAVLDNYFVPKVNVPFERHLFRQMEQSPGEKVDQFVCRLRQRAITCDFDRVDETLRDQLIEKCEDPKLRRKFLEKSNATLKDLQDIARAHEAVDVQMKSLEQSFAQRKPAGGQVNAVSQHTRAPKGGKGNNTTRGSKGGRNGNKASDRKSGTDQTQRCYNCNRTGHYARDKSCPARDQECHECGIRGHFSVCCEKKGSKKLHAKGSEGGDTKGKKVYQVTEEEIHRPGDGYAFTVEHSTCLDRGITSLKVGGVDVSDVLIDSGATCNLMGQTTWEWLKDNRIQCESHKGAKVLFAYGSQEPLKTLGTFTATIESLDSNSSCSADFVVIEGEGRTLLGRETAETLSLLHVGPIHVNRVVGEHTATDIRRDYPDLFTGVGLLKGYELKLHIDDSVRPIAQPVRRLPFGLREKTDEKLDELLEAGIIEEAPEGPSGWVSPLVVVPKGDGDIRVCVDMRRANEAITRERHPIPTVEELMHDLNGSTVFSKLDLKWGFHQIMLSEESRHITTFVTHRGLYRYRRLMFGITSAPEKYQQIIRDVLKKCKGVANIADDLIVHGSGVEEHDQRLFAVLEKLREAGLTLNGKKCEFRLSKLTFFGHELTNKGVNPSDEKVAAIQNAEPPKEVSEVRSFMGLVQYSAKFLPDLATIAQPIQELTRKGAKFSWGTKQQAAFQELKRLMTCADTLAYYKVGSRTRIVADASPVGLGAVLTQQQGTDWRVISYASRSLSDVERRYSQTEKEALALVWACERFNLYVFGQHFELETDHKPLECIYSRTSKPSARIERWVLRLQSYDFKVVYRPGKTNIADALSRLNSTIQRDVGERFDYVRAVVETSVPVALSPREVEEASASDPELCAVKQCVQTGNWEQCPVPAYLHIKDELCMYGELLLRGTRIVIPQSLRDQVTRLAHEGHQGIVKTKNRLRSKVWWPKMDRDAEKVCKVCHGCQVNGEYSAPEPMARVLFPTSAWQDCSADLLGPLPSGDHVLVVVDYFSRYYEVVIMKSTTSSKIIAAITPIFARFGVPYSLRTDNGPQFVSEEFKAFLVEHGIEQRNTIPLWPQANGEVERQNRTLLKVLRIAQVEGKCWKVELNRHLTAYRSTPQMTTGVSPYFLMFGREMHTKLPDVRRERQIRDEEVQERDWERKMKGKQYADEKRRAKESDIEAGDLVLVKTQKKDKLSPNFHPSPFSVVKKEGGEVTLRNAEGVELKRNTSFVRKYNVEDSSTREETRDNSSETTQIDNDTTATRNGIDGGARDAEPIRGDVQAQHPTPSTRPQRTTRMPDRFKDFVL